MNFNSLFFPAPKPSYSFMTYYNELIYIPKSLSQGKEVTISYIPCLYF